VLEVVKAYLHKVVAVEYHQRRFAPCTIGFYLNGLEVFHIYGILLS
jgi:hypothetical protein